MQKPLSPEESQKHLALPVGFEAKLFVAEPQIYKPITMTWDHLGRLYVAETVDYPNEMQPKGKGRDRISIVEDTDGDGKADKVSLFADTLSIPTSLCYVNGGLIVAQAPDMLFLKDTDGDGTADERKVLFTGFGTYDTHAGPSNLRYGLDNWIYAIIGYAGFIGEVGGERHNFRQGFFRFKPDGSKLEFLRSTNNNSWGVGISEEGLLFGSTANGCPSVYMPIANRYYESVRGMAPSVLQNIADSNRFFPITENVRQVDWHGGFTAGAGSALYTARTYPKHYWNKTAFVAEPTGHLVATFTLHPDGTDFHSHNAWNLVASDDEWTSPILAEVGPDGQVWVIDWYNFIVQHNPTPKGYKTGKGSAYETPLRDKTHGRIYRIVAKDGKPSDRPKLSKDDPKGLVAALKNDNMFWRLHAQRLLVERGDRSVAARPRRPDRRPGRLHRPERRGGPCDLGAARAGRAPRRRRSGGDDMVAAVVKGLKHPSPAVRRAAIMALPRNPGIAAACVAERRVRGPRPAGPPGGLPGHVRDAPHRGRGRRLPDHLGPARPAESAGSLDGRRPDVRRRGARPRVLQGAGASRTRRVGRTAADPRHARVAEHYARGGPVDSIASVLALQGDMKPAVRDAIIGGLAKGWPRDKTPKLDADAEQAITELLPKLSPEARGQMLGLASRWGVKGLEPFVAGLARDFLAAASDASKPEAARIDAARQLIDLRKADPQAARDVLALVTARTPPDLASGLIGAVARSDSPEVGPALVDAIGPMTPAARRASILALLGKTDWTRRW